MATVYLGLGSNVDAENNIRMAVHWIQDTFIDAAFSPIYRSRAVGFEGDDFYNLVARVETAVTPLDLKSMLNQNEDQQGRQRNTPKFSDRTVDIDILLYDELVLDDPTLTLPRPEITRFAHVLKPLADLAPDLELPGDGTTIATLWQAFSGNGKALIPVSL